MRIVISCGCEPRSDQLESGGADLTRLALDLGYSSHSHFTSSFRVLFGVPPSAVHHPRLRKIPIRRGASRGGVMVAMSQLCTGSSTIVVGAVAIATMTVLAQQPPVPANPQTAREWRQVGAARRQAKDYDGAIAALRTSLRLETGCPDRPVRARSSLRSEGRHGAVARWLHARARRGAST